MSRSTFVLALAGVLAGSALGAQAQPPAGSPGGPPPAGQPPVGRRPLREDGMRRRPFEPGGPGRGPGRMGIRTMGPGRMDRMRRMGPGPMMGGDGAMGSSLASRLLSSTGELKLTDPQVTRLAAIARRADERRQSMRTRMDSLGRALRADTTARRRAFGPGAQPGGPLGAPLAADMQRMRDQAHVDLRDALSVLTAEQQARLWEMRAGPSQRRRKERQNSPIIPISVSNRCPNFSSTAPCAIAISSRTSVAVAVPARFTMMFACSGEICAPPWRKPLSPA